MCRIILIVALIGLFVHPPSYAQEKKPPEPYRLDDIVVTAAKIPLPEENVTQKVNVIHDTEWEHYTYADRNISEILQYQPGTFVNPLSRNDANWGSYGGLGPKYSTYMLDGLPIDSFADGMSLDPWAFDRVEVQRGPASVMYSNYLSQDFAGNETPLAGTSNFILKEKIDKTLTRVFAGGGIYNTYETKIYHQGSAGNFHYFLGGDYEQSQYTNYGTRPSWLNMTNSPDYNKTKYYFKTTYFFADDHKLSLFVNHAEHDGNAGRPGRDYGHSYDTVNMTYSNRINSWLNLQFKGGYRGYDRNWYEDNFPPNFNVREKDGVKQRIVPMDLTLTMNHMEGGQFTIGSDYQTATYRTYSNIAGVQHTGNNASAYNIGIFAEERLTLGKWVLRGGGRFNYSKQDFDILSGVVPQVGGKSWDKFLWSAGVKYNATDNLAFYANGGSSFLVPSAKAVGGTLNISDFGVPGRNGQLPNPNLQPESGLGFDGGVTYRILPGLSTNIRFFYNRVNDAIVDNVVSQNPSQTRSVNAGASTAYGTEMEVKHKFSKYVQWFANFTYTKTNVENSVDRDQNGTEISFVPDYIGNLGMTINLPWDIMVSPYLHAVGNYYDSTSKTSRSKFGPYEIVNVNIQKMLISQPGYSAKLRIDLTNVTNQKYEMPWQFRNPGFGYFGGVEVIF